jgi:hypothetical protein
MYVARFSYDVMPANRQQALDYIRGELQAARDSGLNGRILVPLTRRAATTCRAPLCTDRGSLRVRLVQCHTLE